MLGLDKEMLDGVMSG